jgi:hypothetical protein
VVSAIMASSCCSRRYCPPPIPGGGEW